MKKIIFIILLSNILNIFVLNFTRGSVPNYLRSFEKIKNTEPKFAQIIKTYFKNEGVTNYHFRSWEKKLKLAPLLPTLYLGYDHSFKKAQGLSINDNISISSGTVTIGPEDNDYDYSSNFGTTFRARAVWKMDELVFNRNYFIMAREKRDIAKIRADLSQRIYKIYELRFIALLKYLQMRRVSSNKASVYYSKYLVLTDRLDAMTGGSFRKRWWKRK